MTIETVGVGVCEFRRWKRALETVHSGSRRGDLMFQSRCGMNRCSPSMTESWLTNGTVYKCYERRRLKCWIMRWLEKPYKFKMNIIFGYRYRTGSSLRIRSREFYALKSYTNFSPRLTPKRQIESVRPFFFKQSTAIGVFIYLIYSHKVYFRRFTIT